MSTPIDNNPQDNLSSSKKPESFWHQSVYPALVKHGQNFLRILAPLYGLLIISTILDQAVSGQVEMMLRSPSGTPPSIWLFALISLLMSVLFPLLQIMIVSFVLKYPPTSPVQVQDFVGENFPQVLIEQLRSWGQCLFYSLLLIIPGFVRLLQLLFVPFVVLFDSNYAEGRADALKISSQVFRKMWWQTLLLVFVLYLFLPLVITSFFDGYRNYFLHPFFAMLMNFFEAILAYLGIVFLFSIFNKSQLQIVKEASNGTHV